MQYLTIFKASNNDILSNTCLQNKYFNTFLKFLAIKFDNLLIVQYNIETTYKYFGRPTHPLAPNP